MVVRIGSGPLQIKCVLLVFEDDRVAHRKQAVIQHLREDTATPVRPHEIAQTLSHLIHPLAWRRLAADGETYRADAENASTCVNKRHAGYHQVRASTRRWNVESQ